MPVPIIILIIFLSLLLLYLIIEVLEHLTAFKYETIENNKGLGEDVRVVLLSDLHNNKKLDEKKIFEKVREFDPECILIPGDLVEDRKDKSDNAVAFVAELSKTAPVFISIGNHEEYLKERDEKAYKETMEELSKYATVLSNATAETEHLNLVGLTVPTWFYWTRMTPKKRNLPVIPPVISNKFEILLAHNPEYVDMYERYSPDLVLSGHMHGGIVRLPFLGALVAPGLSFFPRLTSGLHTENGTRIFVTRGLGSHRLYARFLNKTEINFLTLKGCKKE